MLKLELSGHPLRVMALIMFVLAGAETAGNGEDLIPSQPGKTPDYWCTWAAQNYIWGQGESSIDNNRLFGQGGMELGDENVTEKEIFKSNGWVHLFNKVRGDLIFLLDEGYYPLSYKKGPATDPVPHPSGDKTALQLDPARYPSYADPDPAKSLLHLNQDLQKAGWRGLGLWTRNAPKDLAACQQRMAWSKAAGVLYWKIDTGDIQLKYKSIQPQIDPSLILEYANGIGCFNSGPGNRVPLDYASRRLTYLTKADVIRIYDRDQPLSIPTSLDRVAALLQLAADHPDANAIINCEDEVYIGAALGCSVGIFRSPFRGLRPSGDMDIYMGGPRHPKQRMDEVIRAIRWHRLAPPFAAHAQPVQVDTTILSDRWKFCQGDSWNQSRNGKIDSQSAPARISRGLPLPEVVAEGDVPWTLASRHPGGAVSIATLGRITPEKGYSIPLAEVKVNVGAIPPCFGIFGRYKSLTLLFSQTLPSGAHVLAQDLAGDMAQDITGQVKMQGATLLLPGDLLARIGLSAATPEDESDPGLILVIR